MCVLVMKRDVFGSERLCRIVDLVVLVVVPTLRSRIGGEDNAKINLEKKLASKIDEQLGYRLETRQG